MEKANNLLLPKTFETKYRTNGYIWDLKKNAEGHQGDDLTRNLLRVEAYFSPNLTVIQSLIAGKVLGWEIGNRQEIKTK